MKKQISAAVLKQGEPERYSYFIAHAAEEQRVWGLWRDGWALSQDGEGHRAFPLWPSRELAETCAKGAWAGFVAEEIPVEDLLDQLLPQLARDGLNACVFPVPDARGSTPPLAQLIFDLENALQREPDED